ncbi:ABC transporter permease [Pseudolysinimonas sp.]|uniref:ABC transporter permease n=1 Tax=Pseudolysinimonas sp. TaxID=2680009 RepID=UPI003F81E52C
MTTTERPTSAAPDRVLTPIQAGPAAEPLVTRRAGRAPRFGAPPSRATAVVILAIVGVLFLLPIAAMLIFTFRANGGGYTVGHYLDLFNPELEYNYDVLFQGIQNSLILCVITAAIILVLMVPTMVLIEMRYPRLRRVMEFVCLVPVTIPTIVLVVGLIPTYSVVARLLGSDAWTLAFAIGVIALPYAYRPVAVNIAGVDVRTLTEAGRSLGAGYLTIMWRIILPNLRRGIVAAAFITITVVLGEYTIATFLGRTTFQTGLVQVRSGDPYVAVIFSLLALLFGFVILLIIGRFGAIRPRNKD